jgi:hypothetical protein
MFEYLLDGVRGCVDHQTVPVSAVEALSSAGEGLEFNS